MYFKKDRAIYLVAAITDMRKQINGLARIANEKKADSVFSGDYFVFLGKHYPAILSVELASEDHIEFLEFAFFFQYPVHREPFKCTGF